MSAPTLAAGLIPFNRPGGAPNEATYLAEVLASSTRCGDGPFTKRCQALLESGTGAAKALLTTSCTDALEMSALLLGIRPGDEVVVPSFTFVSSANAFAIHGARIVFCDVRPDTLNLDERRLEALISPRTRAVVVVHYAGIACAMDEILAICARRQVAVVEDNAHGLFGGYRSRALGTLGRLATQSFHETKNFSCGEGGALLINDPALVERAEILREKGTNRALFFRGQVDKYSWVDVGSSFLPSDILAAVLLAQLEHRAAIQTHREAVWRRYDSALADWAARLGARRPVVPPHCASAWHMYHLLMPSLAVRSAFIAHLRQHGVMAVFHYLPLHLSVMGRRHGGAPGDCPVTEDISDRLVRLPLYNSMDAATQDAVIAAVLAFAP